MKAGYFSLLLSLFLLSCSQQENKTTATDQEIPETANEMVQVLATVNGSKITVEELEYARSRLKAPPMSAEQENKLSATLLDSLVSSRLMAQKAEASLSEIGLESLERKTAAFREELLVKNYLSSNVQPTPVSSEAVREYYDKHPEEFGAVKEKSFEVLRSIRDLDVEQKKALLEQLKSARSEADWQEWLSGRTELPLGYKQFRVKIDLLDEPLRTEVQKGAPGDIRLVDSGKQVQLVRILSERLRPPKAFKQVSTEIRKKLAPIAFKEQLSDHIQELKKQATITYIDPQQGE